MNTEFLLLAIFDKPRLSLAEVCKATGLKIKTVYNQRSAHIFPIPMSGKPLMADVRDVAEYIDRKRLDATKMLQSELAHYEE